MSATEAITTTPWDEVIGQPAATAALRAALRSDELAHAWLLVGPRGVGALEIARALSAALNCEAAPTPDVGCGSCSSCQRIARGMHPATVDLEPEGTTHVVEAVRSEWIPTATRSLTEGRRQVLRVVAADRMNEAAQNAFLKVLEEPPPSVVWVLEVEDESALLDTVVSRCRRLDLVPWGPPALSALAQRLEIDPDQQAALVRAAQGSPERLRDLADPDVAAARLRHLEVVNHLASGGPGQLVPLAKELVAWAKGRSAVAKERHAEEFEQLQEAYGVENGRGWPPGIKARLEKRFARIERQEQRRALDLVLDDLASYLRDLLVVRSGAAPDALINLDHDAQVRRDAYRLTETGALAGLRAIAECREALERNGSPELQFERVLLAIALPIYASTA